MGIIERCVEILIFAEHQGAHRILISEIHGTVSVVREFYILIFAGLEC
jgi:hypothetical protein